ncbi:YgjV family protein [Anaeromicropila populeti]|uniref:Inner membrane protein n=1 Tax=Anaeromicropila populeti TaxID=37658 RepID=A0A1I6IMP4_9FIRM|nr:YgjV family protein [Anaeromicropila populeti]SFR67992.1 inner membrane protein [Anaeromicropila populeti]
MHLTLIDIFGYSASILVAVSFLMKSIKKLRFVNIVGSTCFVIYSIVIKAWPVALINIFIVGINIYYLCQKGEK